MQNGFHVSCYRGAFHQYGDAASQVILCILSQHFRITFRPGNTPQRLKGAGLPDSASVCVGLREYFLVCANVVVYTQPVTGTIVILGLAELFLTIDSCEFGECERVRKRT